MTPSDSSRRLILMRHGHAHPEGALWEDFDRPLSTRGQQEAERVGRALRAQALLPDLLLVSAARRTRESADIVAHICGIDVGRIRTVAELYQASAAKIWAHLEQQLAGKAAPALPVGCLLICAHNPGLSDLASELGPRPARRELAPAGTVTASWSAVGWAGLQPATARECRAIQP